MRRIAVIGAGAAGTMAAIFAARSRPAGVEVMLIERTLDGGRKIVISGGGRCNILPSRVDQSRFVSDSPAHLVRPIVRSWPLHEQIAFFESDLKMPLVEEPDTAKLFPRSESGRDVRDRLLSYAAAQGVTLVRGATVVDFFPDGRSWQIVLEDRSATQPITAEAVIVATGGLSVPKTGSDGRGLSIVETLGHALVRPYPALTPLVAPDGPFSRLAGVSLDVTIAARAGQLESASRGGFLFTHNGYSGPAVLDISHVPARSRQEGAGAAEVLVSWADVSRHDWEMALKARGSRMVTAALSEHLPQRLAHALAEHSGVPGTQPLSQLTRAERLRLIESLTRTVLPWNGDEGYKKAEVTGGGVMLSEIDLRTLESRRHKGLFLCGEMLDAFGPIGGYNFLWAWATGRAAGLGVNKVLC